MKVNKKTMDEATEETLRYAAEQALEDAGFEVDVSLLRNDFNSINIEKILKGETDI